MKLSKSKTRKKKPPKRVLAIPDLEPPRLAFNRTVVLRSRIHLEQRLYAPAESEL